MLNFCQEGRTLKICQEDMLNVCQEGLMRLLDKTYSCSLCRSKPPDISQVTQSLSSLASDILDTEGKADLLTCQAWPLIFLTREVKLTSWPVKPGPGWCVQWCTSGKTFLWSDSPQEWCQAHPEIKCVLANSDWFDPLRIFFFLLKYVTIRSKPQLIVNNF